MTQVGPLSRAPRPKAHDCIFGNAEARRKISENAVVSSRRADDANSLFGENRLGMFLSELARASAVPNLVRAVFGGGFPTKVSSAIVLRIAVYMRRLMRGCRGRPMKRRAYEAVDKSCFLLPSNRQANLEIAPGAASRGGQKPPGREIVARNGAPDFSKIADLIVRGFVDPAPLLHHVSNGGKQRIVQLPAGEWS